MVTLKVGEASEKPQPKLKRYLARAIENNPLGTLSHIPYGLLPIEEIRDYIHANMEEHPPSKLGDI